MPAMWRSLLQVLGLLSVTILPMSLPSSADATPEPVLPALAEAAPVASADAPPVAPVEPTPVRGGGERRIDPYYWLRERDDPRTRAYLEAENAWTARWFEPRAALRETLYQEMRARLKADDETAPARRGRWWYSSRLREGAQYPLYLRRAAVGEARGFDPAAVEQPLLDLQALSVGKAFLRLGALQVSPDDAWLAYTLDETGGLDYRLQLRRIADGVELPLVIAQVSDAVWANDSRTLYYVTMDEAKRSHRLWRRVVIAADGASLAGGDAELLYEERDERFNLDLARTRDQRYLIAGSHSHESSELRVYDADRPRARARLLLKRRPQVEYEAEHRDGAFWLRINDRSPQFRVLRVDVTARGAAAEPVEVVPDREHVAIDAIDAFAGHLVLTERVQGALQLRVLDLAADPTGAHARTLDFDEAAYAVQVGTNLEFDSGRLRFEYESLTLPRSTWELDLQTWERRLLKREPVEGGYDPAQYDSARTSARAADGTEVPVSLVWRRDLRRSGPQPLLLYGYGAYGLPTDPWFSATRVSLLDRGVIFAIAHVRGGGDLGRRWYEAGRLEHKHHSFSDFVASARMLVERGYTEPSMLAAEGGSAGGLLVTAALNLDRSLFRAVVARVPFVDVLTTMLDPTIPLTTGEYVEWGNPKLREQYAWMRAYSPYDNLEPGAYPAIYVRAGFNDSQVQYWEPAKYVAKLRGLRTDDRPLLLHTDLELGHGGASGRYDALRERAEITSFVLDQLGVVSR